MIFIVNLYITPFHGANVVLGMDKMKCLGLILFDFSQMMIKFTNNGSEIVLSYAAPTIFAVSSPQLQRDITTKRLTPYSCLELLKLRRRIQWSSQFFRPLSNQFSMTIISFLTNQLVELQHVIPTIESSCN